MVSKIGESRGDATPKRRGRKPGSASVPTPVQSLSRALGLLVQLAENSNGVLLVDLAAQLELAASTTHRLLTTLEQQGFAEQDVESGKWRVGVTAFTVGNAFLASRDIGAQSKSVARQLMESAGETANVAVLQAGEIVIIAQAECHEMMRMIVPLGSRVPPHASGVGKAILSTLPNDSVEVLLKRRGMPSLTEHTLVTPESFQAALVEVRKHGYALDNEEQAIGLRCAAAPIFGASGEAVAAISLSGPKSRISAQRLEEFGQLVRDAANEISSRLGGQKPPD